MCSNDIQPQRIMSLADKNQAGKIGYLFENPDNFLKKTMEVMNVSIILNLIIPSYLTLPLPIALLFTFTTINHKII